VIHEPAGTAPNTRSLGSNRVDLYPVQVQHREIISLQEQTRERIQARRGIRVEPKEKKEKP
jgi:hypothetical protein